MELYVSLRNFHWIMSVDGGVNPQGLLNVGVNSSEILRDGFMTCWPGTK